MREQTSRGNKKTAGNRDGLGRLVRETERKRGIARSPIPLTNADLAP
ncbi:hypothetical protein [Cohnella soli]|uniref:Uncharacterized protein n=1 Tax=Cohnella soli TaxID=425005 RepID=A0ABW0I1F3_9BACL